MIGAKQWTREKEVAITFDFPVHRGNECDFLCLLFSLFFTRKTYISSRVARARKPD